MRLVSDDSVPQACAGRRRGARAQQAVCHSLCHCVRDCGLPVACLPRLRFAMGLPSPQHLLLLKKCRVKPCDAHTLDGVRHMLEELGRI